MRFNRSIKLPVTLAEIGMTEADLQTVADKAATVEDVVFILDIANRLKLSTHTVETHRARIMDKLGLHTAAELVLSAVRRGLVQ